MMHGAVFRFFFEIAHISKLQKFEKRQKVKKIALRLVQC